MDVAAEVGWLSRMRFVTRKRWRGGSWGERRSTRRGQGLEFADYREYTPGDDPRRVDWNLYARLDRPYVRLYEEEEDLAVTVWLDSSLSMVWGTETAARWPKGQQVALALGVIALLGGDLLRGTCAYPDLLPFGPLRGRGRLVQWERWVMALEATEATAILPSLQQLAARQSRPGLVLLLSDGYNPEELSAGIATLSQRGHEVILLHLLTPDELSPALRGDLRLVDAETGQRREVTVDGAVMAAYRRKLTRWQQTLRATVGKHGGRYAMLRTDLPLKRLVGETLRHADVVR